MVEGGTEDRVWNSDRFLQISSREAALEGLEKDELKGFEGLDGFVGFLERNGEMGLCCCWRLALTSEKWEENEDWDWDWDEVEDGY